MTNDRRTLLKGAALAAAALTGAGAAPSQASAARPSARRYKRIATEEGWSTQEFLNAQAKYLETHNDEPGLKGRGATSAGGPGLVDMKVRVADMDRTGVDMQVLLLSSPGVQIFGPEEGTALSRMVNDAAAQDCRDYPGRFCFLAAVAPQAPDAAAKEMQRAVHSLGAKGAIINSHTKGEHLDLPKFWPIFEAAEAMDVPIYLHPREPTPAMLPDYQPYPGLSQAMWGYAAETGLHAMRLILGGVFDRFPKLQIVIGHVGENIPFTLDRIDNRYKITLQRGAKKTISRLPSEYFHDNFIVTTSGANWPPGVKFCQQVLGVDKVLFAIDYPFEENLSSIAQADTIPMTDAEKLAFFQTNAERVFKIKA